MSETRVLKVLLTGDAKSAVRALTDVEKKSKGLKDETDESTTKMGRLARAQQTVARAAVPAAGAIAGLGIAMFKSAQAASEMDDTLSATKVVFGNAAASVISFSEKAAKSFGLSKQAALDAAGQFGTFGKAAGLQGPALSNFSNQMTGLAGDLASFKGGTPEEAVTAIGAAMRGETEPIRRYGVMLDDVSLRSQAMKMGLIKTTKDALTPQQKTLAAHALILSQTKDAQGDFTRTSSSAKNQQSRLKAELANTAVTLGQKLLPVLAGGAKMLAGMAEWAGKNTGAVKIMAIAIGAIAGVILAVSVATKIASAAMAVWSAGVRIAAAVQWLWNAAMSMNPIGLIVLAVVALIAIIVLLWKKSETFRKIVMAVWSGIKTAVMAVVNWFKSSVLPAFTAIWRFIVSIFNKVKAFLVAVFNGYKAIFLAVLNWIVARWKATWNTVKSVFSTVWNGIKSVFNVIRNGVANVVNGIVSKVVSIKTKIVGFFAGAGKWLLDAGKNIINGLISGITNMIGSLKDKFKFVTDMIPDWKGPESLDKVLLKPAGQMLIKGLITGIDMETPAVKSTLLGLTGSIAATTEGGMPGGVSRLAVAGATAQAGMVVNVTVMGHVTTEDKLADSVALKVRDRIARNGARNGSTGV